MRTVHMVICILALSVGMVMAAYLPSLERGKELFNSTMLGTNGKSCASCHSHGKMLKNTGTFDDAKLELIINQCIHASLDGSPLPSGSPDMASLVMYLRSLVIAAAH